MARRKKRIKIKSAKTRADAHTGEFTNTVIKLPPEVKQFKFKKAGIYLLDILPYKVGDGNPEAENGEYYYERTYFAHRGIGADGNMYVCPKKTAGKKCPICDFRQREARGDDVDEDLIKDLAIKERQLFNVYDRKNPDDGVQILDMSFYLFGKLLDTEIRNEDEDDGYSSFYDPEDGYTLKLVVEQNSIGGNNFYSVESIAFKTRKTPIDDELLEEAVCLDELLIINDYKFLKTELLQSADVESSEEEDDDDDEVEEAPKKKSKKSKSKKKSEPEDDDDDDDDEVEEAPKKKSRRSKKKEVAEEEAPKKKSKKSKKKSEPEPEEDDDDDWDDDDDDDDDEVEEAPKKKSKKSKSKKKSEPEPEEDDDDDDDDDDDWDDDDDD